MEKARAASATSIATGGTKTTKAAATSGPDIPGTMRDRDTGMGTGIDPENEDTIAEGRTRST